MKKAIYLAFLLGATAVLPAVACDQQIADKKKYQYVLLFGGDFPIPLRFRLVSWEGNTLEYSSSAPYVRDGGDSWSETTSSGIIGIGPRQMLENEVGYQSVVTPITTCGSLEISRVTPKDMPEELRQKFPSMTLIVDEKNYVTIVDYDENLWREIVGLYAKNADMASCQI